MARRSIPNNRAWVVLVTDGTVIAYPPEIYRSRSRAVLESERWAWVLAGEGVLEIERPFDDRWSVADRDVRLIEVGTGGSLETPWIGTYWTRDGAPDPEAVVLADEVDARAWVRESPRPGFGEPRTFDNEWFSVAVYVVRGEEEYAVAHLAKVVS
jgi:hypothetical protein